MLLMHARCWMQHTWSFIVVGIIEVIIHLSSGAHARTILLFNALWALTITNGSTGSINNVKLEDDFDNDNNMNDDVCYIQCLESINNLHHTLPSASMLLIRNR